MQSDSMELSAFEDIKEASFETITPPSVDKSFQCSKCILVFKSKVYLFEHLNKVHGLDVEAALKGAGLKSAETYRNRSRSSGKHFKCQHCGFKACNLEALNEHKTRCKKNEDLNLSGKSIVSENPEVKITLPSTNQQNEASEEMPSIVSVMSLSEAQYRSCSPKDLKTYKRPSQTITKYFAVESRLNTKPRAAFKDETEGTLILQDSPSSSSASKDGVFKVTATPKIDIDNRGGYFRFLQYEHLIAADLESKPKEQLEETARNNLGIKTKNDSSEGPSAKKAKSGDEKILKSKSPSEQPSSSTEFSFEVSDEEEKSNVDGAPRKPKVYFCKQCDYNNVSFSHVSLHYQSEHPFIRCKSIYIHSPRDQSATFRCLECPVEFESAIDLKWHYVENHPDAPDVFKLKFRDLDLVFKCFQCSFTSTDSKALRQHYTAMHPTFEVSNSLLFCKYSVTPCQVESPLPETCEKTPSPERTGEQSPEKANMPLKEAKDTPSPQHLTPKGSGTSLYKCNKCEFAHKSVVVLHVHYQRNHPEEAMTIPKIKELTRVATHSTSPPAPLKETLEKTTDKLELSQQNVSLSVPECEAVVSSNQPASPETKKVEFVEKDSKIAVLPVLKKSNGKVTAGMDRSACSSQELMYCKFCDYTSKSIKSVVGHQCAKHSTITSISKKEIILYSAEMRKKILKRKSRCKIVKVRSKTEADSAVTGHEAYLHAETLFYCQECNFAHLSAKGVLNHQNRTHKCIKSNCDAVVKHTTLIRDEIEKSKSLDKGSSPSYLPLPFVNKGDENKFFCHLCNYRHGKFAKVVYHCGKRHNVLDVTASIQQYSSKVLKLDAKSPSKTVVNEEVKPVKMKQKKKEKVVKNSSGSAPASLSDLKSPKILQCYKCPYSAKYLYLLRNHLLSSHQSNRSVTDLLRTYFRKGIIQAGYHCQWCGYSHKDAATVLKHYQEQHPNHKSNYEYVRSRLYVGADALIPKRKRTKKMPTCHGDASLAEQRSGQNGTEMYLCRACSFKSVSESGLERHYQAVHPGLSKEDGSGLLNDKKASAHSQVDDLDEMPGIFESFQAPLEDAEEIISSSMVFKCTSCPARFNTEHGLNTHCGMKHIKAVNAKEEQKETKQPPRLHVFKCPYCTYVNTTYQGVLTHSQMKHPTSDTMVDSLYVEISTLQNQDKFLNQKDSGGTLKFSGYLCKTCPQICATLGKLDKHSEQHLNETKSSTVTSSLQKTAPKTSALNIIKTPKVLKIQRSASKTLFLSKKATAKCPHCSYSSNTKIALKQHMYIQHKDTVSNDFVYKCEICPQFYFSKIRLGKHYSKRHGKKAFLKYFVPVYKQACKKFSLGDQPSAQQPENNSTEVKRLVYRCPSCPYVNTRHHGTLTHCQMKHPNVLVRAEALETGEILVENLIKCSLGKGSNERGYVCKKCPQIHASMARLQIHCKRDHGKKAASMLPAETQKQHVNFAQSSVLDVDSPEKETSEVSVAETVPSLCAPEMAPLTSVSEQSKTMVYECQNCAYKANHRKNLRCHYEKTHKLDAHTIYRLMEKYNLRKRNYLPQCRESDKSAGFKCKSCPDLMFNSSQLLIDHYTSHHGLVCKSDFIVISLGLKWKTTGVYKCAHCMTILNGTKILQRHLERHKASMVKMAEGTECKSSPDGSAPEPTSTQLIKQEEVHTQENITAIETLTLPPTPQLPPLKVTVEPDVEDKERHACKQCRRTFISLKSLRSHERGHAAMAAIKKDNLSNSQLSIYKYVLHKSGIQKCFQCGCCAYRTSLLGLWRSHFMKKHQDIVQKDNVQADNKDENTQWPSSELLDTSEKMDALSEPDDEPKETEKSLYLEPRDVQRQLNQYSLMAHTFTKSSETVQEAALPEIGLLHCEICNFKTEHLSSIRRHYLNRHGKKILRCKKCNFFSGLQKTLDVHMETGHSTYQSEPTHQKDLLCPFCLYQTKNKNNMIDHIVLHREERVVPIEVRRPKLSRYLQGKVFRCHQCTFSSGSAENLRLHTMRHDGIKPYKCRLCYFDCTQLSDLETHLSDKHQVLRNHELVGQVSLDQLEAREDVSEKHDKNSNNSEEEESEEYFTDCDEIPQSENLEEDGTDEKMSTQAHEKDEQDKKEESPTKSSILGIQCNDANPGTAAQKEHEKDPETQVEVVPLQHTARQENVAEGNSSESQYEDCSGSEEEERNDDQDKRKENAADENGQDPKMHLKLPHHRILDIEAKVEDDILDNILQLDGDSGIYKIHKRTDEMMMMGREQQDTEAQPINLSLNNRGNITNDQNPKIQPETNSISTASEINNAQSNNPKAKGSFTLERHLLTLSPNYIRLKLSHQDSLGVSFAISKLEQKQNLNNGMEASEPCEQMPVLENEYVKEEPKCLKSCKQEEETDHVEQRWDKQDDTNAETPKDQDTPHVNKDVEMATDGAAEVQNEENRFACEFCGRNLANISELNRHVVRHRM